MSDIVNDLSVYKDVDFRKKTKPSTDAQILRRAVVAYGKKAYEYPAELLVVCKKENMRREYWLQLTLFLSDESVSQYISSLHDVIFLQDYYHLLRLGENLGLSSMCVRVLASDILYSLGAPQYLTDSEVSAITRDSTNGESDTGSKTVGGILPKQNLYLPYLLYYEKLDEAEKKLQKGTELSTDDLAMLQLMDNAGVSKASYLLAFLLLYPTDGKTVTDADRKQASIYAAKAYRNGYTPAGGILADCAFSAGQYQSAYKYYSEPGARAMNRTQMYNFDFLMNLRKYTYNKIWRLMLLTIFFTAAEFLAAIFFSYTEKPMIIKLICPFFQIFSMAAVYIYHHYRPFNRLYGYLVWSAVIFFGFICIILF